MDGTDSIHCNKRTKEECGSGFRIDRIIQNFFLLKKISTKHSHQMGAVEILDLNFNCKSEKRAVVLEDLVREMRPMKHLKTLSSLAGMKVSGEDISYFLKNCPLLRELNMTALSLTSDLHVSGDLEILRISGCTIRNSVIYISAPHLYETEPPTVQECSKTCWKSKI
ncbi:hypothetical protein SASPL_134512 [Salvia splendens]|uniref:Uncharacterized protein n=1 Tax=Salvia splendens TaxID=180675 RepID=A0A8X8X4M8_SALSN|nr:hypothetical protein SASPL_134512 [Salvia splendens]